MHPARLLSSPREPAVLAAWLLIVFGIGELAFNVWHADAPDVIFLSFALVPWFVGPAALAALLGARARSRGEAWAFVGAEVAAVASTTWLWIALTLVKTGHANSESAVALILLPIVQFAVLLVYALVVIATADFALTNRQQYKPRTTLLTILSIAGAVLLIVLAWAFGYVRA